MPKKTKAHPTLGQNSLDPKITLRSKDLSDRQRQFLRLALHEDTKIIFIAGPAGSTKTYISVYAALRQLKREEGLDLLYVRTAIESAEKGLGALPGSVEEKINPYMAPLEDKLSEILPRTTGIKQEQCP